MSETEKPPRARPRMPSGDDLPPRQERRLWDLLAQLNGQLEGLSTVQSAQHRIVLDKLQAEEGHHKRISEGLDELRANVDEAQTKAERRFRRLEHRDSLRSRARRNPDIRSGIIAGIVALATGIGTYLQTRADKVAPTHAAPSQQR